MNAAARQQRRVDFYFRPKATGKKGAEARWRKKPK
jgi:hypothetical protein